MRYQAAQRLPCRAGFTVAVPAMTWSLMPSFGQGVIGSEPNSRGMLVSLSQNSSVGWAPSDAGPASSSSSPRNGWGTRTASSRTAASTGASTSTSHAQVLRNHMLGNTCTVSASGPALVTRTVISTSVGSALA